MGAATSLHAGAVRSGSISFVARRVAQYLVVVRGGDLLSNFRDQRGAVGGGGSSCLLRFVGDARRLMASAPSKPATPRATRLVRNRLLSLSHLGPPTR